MNPADELRQAAQNVQERAGMWEAEWEALAEWLKAEARSWDMINKDVPSYSACLRLARLINGEASDD